MNWKGAVVADFLPRAAKQLSGGIPVVRQAADLPGDDTPEPLFRITDGLIRLRRCVGVVTTAIDAEPTLAHLVYLSEQDELIELCTPTDLGGTDEGTLMSLTGQLSDSWKMGIITPDQALALLMGPGTIALVCGAHTRGQVQWKLTYLALDPDATVTVVDPPPPKEPDAVEREVSEAMVDESRTEEESHTPPSLSLLEDI